jgi:hypothetical protein
MKKAVYILLAILLLTYGYKAYQAVSVHLNDMLKIRSKGVLSDITDKVVSIPLETPDSGSVTHIKRVLKDGDDLFLLSNNRLLHYDISGKFINPVARDIAENGESIGSYTLNTDRRQIIVIDSRRNITVYSYSGKLLSRTALPHQWYRISALEYYKGYLWATAKTLARMNEADNSCKIRNNLYQLDHQMNIISETALRTADTGRVRLWEGLCIDGLLAGDEGLYAYCSPYSQDYLLDDTLHILEQKKIPSLHTGETFGSGCIYNLRRGDRFFIANNGFTFCYDNKSHTAYKLNEGFKDNFFGTGNVSCFQPVDIYGNTYCYFSNATEHPANLYIFTLKT